MMRTARGGIAFVVSHPLLVVSRQLSVPVSATNRHRALLKQTQKSGGGIAWGPLWSVLVRGRGVCGVMNAVTKIIAVEPGEHRPEHVSALTVSCCRGDLSVRFGSVHLVKYEEALDGWTGPLTSRPYTNRKSFES